MQTERPRLCPTDAIHPEDGKYFSKVLSFIEEELWRMFKEEVFKGVESIHASFGGGKQSLKTDQNRPPKQLAMFFFHKWYSNVQYILIFLWDAHKRIQLFPRPRPSTKFVCSACPVPVATSPRRVSWKGRASDTISQTCGRPLESLSCRFTGILSLHEVVHFVWAHGLNSLFRLQWRTEVVATRVSQALTPASPSKQHNAQKLHCHMRNVNEGRRKHQKTCPFFPVWES